jgi:hypothetical protein
VGAPRSSLEYGTKLDTPEMGRWVFTLYTNAAEGGGSFRSALGERRPSLGPPPTPTDWRADAAQRARGQLRRYCTANGLNRLGTLTYAGEGCHDATLLRRDVGDRFAYLWVPEWHPGGHGLHVHFAVGRYIAVGAIREAWGRGHVHIKLLGDLPVGSGTLGEARLAARYLSKYACKDLGIGNPSGLHRYEVAQGFQPRREALSGTTADEVVASAESRMGAPAAYVWRSRDTEDWAGPPAVWASW